MGLQKMCVEEGHDELICPLEELAVYILNNAYTYNHQVTIAIPLGTNTNVLT